jgi:signal transduction histidine kinase
MILHMLSTPLSPTAASVINSVVRLLNKGESEKAIRTLVRMPDRVMHKEPELAPEALADALHKLHSDDVLEHCVLLFSEGLFRYRTGRIHRAVEVYHKVIELSDTLPSTIDAWALKSGAMCSTALALYRTSNLDQAIQYARSAANLAKQHSAFWMEGSARLAMGNALRYLPGERARARASLEEAYRLYSTAVPPDDLALAFIRRQEARLAMDAGKPSQALSLIREASAGFKRAHENRALAHAKVDQGWAHLQLRSLGVARECALEAQQQLEQIGDRSGPNRVWRLLGWVYIEQGKYDEAVIEFQRVIKYAADMMDDEEKSDGQIGLAWAHFRSGHIKEAQKALDISEPLLKKKWSSLEGLYWQALDSAIRIRRKKLDDLSNRIRKLRAALARYDAPRITAECMALVGFELAQQNRLRDAAPIIKETLSAASQIDAAVWTERFMSTAGSVDVRQWIASLITEMSERESLAEQYETMRICSIAGLHDVKNLATSAYSELEILTFEVEDLPAPVLSAKDTAFKAGRLAADVESQIISGNTQILVEAQPLDISVFLQGQQETINRSSNLGTCQIDVQENLPAVLADERYLTRVFGNFKSNAEKYAHGCDITLSARMNPGKKREIVIGFADNGQGMDPEDAEIAFNAFKNPEDYRQRRTNHGSGFGLHYCKLVIEAHGGRVWVDPRPGQGAIFYFTLPAQ